VGPYRQNDDPVMNIARAGTADSGPAKNAATSGTDGSDMATKAATPAVLGEPGNKTPVVGGLLRWRSV
jgi:hypothetical protein